MVHIDQKTLDSIRLFSLFDKNKDGAISQSDLRSFFHKSFQMKLSREDARQILTQINKEHHVEKKQMDRLDFDTFSAFILDLQPGEYCRGKSLVIQYGRTKGNGSISSSSLSPPKLPKLATSDRSIFASHHTGGGASSLKVPRSMATNASPLSPASPRQLRHSNNGDSAHRSPSPHHNSVSSPSHHIEYSTHLPSIHSRRSKSPTKSRRDNNTSTSPSSNANTDRLSSLFGFKPQKKVKKKNGLKDWLGREQQADSHSSPRKSFKRSVKRSHFSDSRITTTSTQKKAERKKMESMLRDAFSVFDTNHDDLITTNDFVHCMQQILRIPFSSKQVDEVSSFFEKKELDFDDFVLLLTRVYSVEL